MTSAGQIRAEAVRFGWPATVRSLLLRGLQYRLGVHLCVVRVRPLSLNSPIVELPNKYELAMLDRDILLQASRDPELSMSSEFVDAALSRGDVAFGVLDNGRLVAYMWRTLKSAPHTDGLWVKVNRPYRYGYKGYTHPNWRGQHLNTALSFFSDGYFLQRGYTQDVGLIDLHNSASLATGKHKGNRRIGYAGYFRWFGRSIAWCSPGARRIGFDLFVPRI